MAGKLAPVLIWGKWKSCSRSAREQQSVRASSIQRLLSSVSINKSLAWLRSLHVGLLASLRLQRAEITSAIISSSWPRRKCGPSLCQETTRHTLPPTGHAAPFVLIFHHSCPKPRFVSFAACCVVVWLYQHAPGDKVSSYYQFILFMFKLSRP